jgi:hypothetical protein
MTFNPNRWNAAIHESKDWLAGDLRLARPNGSVLHQLLEAWKDGELIEGPPETAPGFDPVAHFDGLLAHLFHPFVIEHDWAGAFANSDIKLNPDGGTISYQQPYNHCCFEMTVSGKRVCLISNLDDHGYGLAAFVRLQLGWFQSKLNAPESRSLRHLLFSQHRAVLVALDATVATADIVRAPDRLNRAREKNGKLPLFDYHVVQLARRSKPSSLPPENASMRNGPRLHFRRGHWRHFETFKTWINWMLVGDPDLGFIDKHYRL